MKKLLTIFFCLAISAAVSAQKSQVDSVAIMILDHMSDVIGDLGSCSFNLTTSNDTKDEVHGLVKQYGNYEVYMTGPDKMLVNLTGPKGHQEYFYNGSQFYYYSFDENNYAMLDSPGTIIETIDTINKGYGIEFPAADFFYPTFTDDLLASSDQIAFLGYARIDGKECFHIQAAGKTMNIQLWISNDALNLPVKYLIVYNKLEGNPQYEATFSDWQVNPNLPSAMFDFLPPPGAAKIRMISKSGK